MPLDTSSQATAADPTTERARRLGYLRIDATTCERLRRLTPVVTAALPGIADRFYAYISQHENLAQLLGTPDRIAKLKQTQMEHWRHLFQGSFDETYFQRAIAIGHAHERIGLQPRWYTGAYALILGDLVATLTGKSRPKDLAEDISVVLRAAFLDMDLAISTYIEAGETTRIRREMLAVSEVLEREMAMSSAEITRKAERLSEMAEQLGEVAQQVRAMAEAVSSSVEITAQNVQTVASATQQLEASSQEITTNVGRASSMTQEAVQQVAATGTTVKELSSASGRIADVVGLVRSIAGQTKLLALNATIEAARAGDAGKGFAVVASEVKSLARQTEDAIGNVNAQAQSIAGATTNAASMVGQIAEQVRSVHAIAAEVAGSTAQQREATAEIMRNVTLAAEHIGSVANSARDLLGQAQTTDTSARQFRTLAKSVSTEIHDLHQRLAVILRASQAGNRRRVDREPVAIGFSFTAGGTATTGYTADVSSAGALLVAEAPASLVGQHIALTLKEIGRIDGVVRGVSRIGIHVEFAALDAATTQAITRALNESRTFNSRYISLCQSVAADVGKTFQQAQDTHRITEAALFSNQYQEIADTNPQQYLSTTTELCDALLPALIERARRSDSRIVFCIACDRNGYIATHHPDVSQKQRAGDTTWNTANSRNRRIFDDRAGILAARNPNPILVQTYQRDLGHGKTVLKEFDSPIMVHGQQWGAVRLAIKL